MRGSLGASAIGAEMEPRSVGSTDSIVFPANDNSNEMIHLSSSLGDCFNVLPELNGPGSWNLDGIPSQYPTSGNPFDNPLSNHFEDPFEGPFDNSFDHPFNNAFNNTSNNPFGNRYDNPFNTLCGMQSSGHSSQALDSSLREPAASSLSWSAAAVGTRSKDFAYMSESPSTTSTHPSRQTSANLRANELPNVVFNREPRTQRSRWAAIELPRPTRYKCVFCYRELSSKVGCRRHLEDQHLRAKFCRCSGCHQTFNSVAKADLHCLDSRICSGKKGWKEWTKPLERDVYSSEFADIVFTSRSEYVTHLLELGTKSPLPRRDWNRKLRNLLEHPQVYPAIINISVAHFGAPDKWKELYFGRKIGHSTAESLEKVFNTAAEVVTLVNTLFLEHPLALAHTSEQSEETTTPISTPAAANIARGETKPTIDALGEVVIGDRASGSLNYAPGSRDVDIQLIDAITEQDLCRKDSTLGGAVSPCKQSHRSTLQRDTSIIESTEHEISQDRSDTSSSSPICQTLNLPSDIVTKTLNEPFSSGSPPLRNANLPPSQPPETPEYNWCSSAQTPASASQLTSVDCVLTGRLVELIEELSTCQDDGDTEYTRDSESHWSLTPPELVDLTEGASQRKLLDKIVQCRGQSLPSNPVESSQQNASSLSGSSQNTDNATRNKRSREDGDREDGDEQPEKIQKLDRKRPGSADNGKGEVIQCIEPNCPGRNPSISEWLRKLASAHKKYICLRCLSKVGEDEYKTHITEKKCEAQCVCEGCPAASEPGVLELRHVLTSSCIKSRERVKRFQYNYLCGLLEVEPRPLIEDYETPHDGEKPRRTRQHVVDDIIAVCAAQKEQNSTLKNQNAVLGSRILELSGIIRQYDELLKAQKIQIPDSLFLRLKDHAPEILKSVDRSSFDSLRLQPAAPPTPRASPGRQGVHVGGANMHGPQANAAMELPQMPSHDVPGLLDAQMFDLEQFGDVGAFDPNEIGL